MAVADQVAQLDRRTVQQCQPARGSLFESGASYGFDYARSVLLEHSIAIMSACRAAMTSRGFVTPVQPGNSPGTESSAHAGLASPTTAVSAKQAMEIRFINGALCETKL
jgi:hypothetical protein